MDSELLNQLYKQLMQPVNLAFVFLVAFGFVLKKTKQIPNWTIPYILGVTGAILGYFLLGGLPGSLIGFIFATVSVYGHQLITQFLGRKEDK